MSKNIKLISWNVNGIRAAERKGFLDFLKNKNCDIVSVQETKVSHPELLSADLLAPANYNSYFQYHNTKKGYSGVATYTKTIPEKVVTEFSDKVLGEEGRTIELHFEKFILLNIYFPNGGRSVDRLNYKLKFYEIFCDHLKQLQKTKKGIIFCGDVNTAHHEIDLARPKENIKTSGFMPEEREWLDRFESLGFLDAFRLKHSDEVKYSWWDMKSRARDRNVGWRIDYFYVSKDLKDKVKECDILTDEYGSDHAPTFLEINL